jgi:hypothetical protein
VSIRDEMLIRNRNVRESVDGLAESVIKTEQYPRRDTVTVVGLPMHESESQDNLCKKVAETLSLSGSAVKPADLSTVHCNSKGSKLIKGKTVPPSITVRFCQINQRNNVLRGYRNYDVRSLVWFWLVICCQESSWCVRLFGSIVFPLFLIMLGNLVVNLFLDIGVWYGAVEDGVV